jgi:hypothetical protein
MKNFSLKFIDIMVGIVLGLGFQLWPNLQEPWQYIAFIFVYIDIVDYWIDYGPSLKKFPPKKEIDVILDISIMFALFLYIYTTQLGIIYFLSAFILFMILDYFWLLSSKYEYRPVGTDKIFIDTWMKFNLVEAVGAAIFIILSVFFSPSSLVIISAYILFRLITRVLASWKYKKVHFI